MRMKMKKRCRNNYAAAAAASFSLLATSSPQLSDAFCIHNSRVVSKNNNNSLCSHGRCRNTLYAQKGSNSKTRNNLRSSSSSQSSVAVEEVKPLTSVSNERRLNALEALTKKRSGDDLMDSPPLFADMDAAAMLLETFTKATNGSDGDPENKSGVAQKRMGSVPGAMRMSTLRQLAAEEGGYALSPRETESLYSNGES